METDALHDNEHLSWGIHTPISNMRPIRNDSVSPAFSTMGSRGSPLLIVGLCRNMRQINIKFAPDSHNQFVVVTRTMAFLAWIANKRILA